MIAQEIVENILDKADIVEVISDYVNLKKRGTNYIGNCPFHDEKTPSFSVSIEKNIFKCFGCGMAGNAVGFLMEHENLSYPEALITLAKKYNIDIPRKNLSEQEQKKVKEAEQLYHIYNFADTFYHSNIRDNEVVASLLKERAIPEEIAVKFHLGYAPNSNSFLKHAKQQGLLEEPLLKSTLVKESKYGLHDFFYDRLMFPIHSPSGRVLAFGGRLISGQGPKYLNSNDTDIYNKSEVLYGIFQARKSIKALDECILVEGYTDVLRFHSIEVENVVASCGTALTQGQIDLVKKYTNNFKLIYDGDSAGHDAMHRNAEMIIQSQCQVKVVILPYQRFEIKLIADHPENCESCEIKKIDPDSFYVSRNVFDEYNSKNTHDYLFYFARERLAKDSDPEKKQFHIKQLCNLLINYSSITRTLYIDKISKLFKIKLKLFNDCLKSLENEIKIKEEKEAEKSIPTNIDIKEFEKYGYYIEKNAYYFSTRYGIQKGSNFIINPLFHIYSKSDNKRLIEIVNESGYKKIVDISSKSFVSFEQFQQKIFEEGNFLFFAKRPAFFKILSRISDDFPICQELKTMGWRKEGFFAFANGIFTNKWQPINDYGIVEFKKQKYFSPAFSIVYQDVNEDDDEYENDRFFIYRKSPITFNEWCEKMVSVYKDKGMFGIAYLVATLFRDLIYEKFKFFPILFLFGQPQSGKSALAWSISNVFFGNMPGFNLNSGTDVGFFRHLARYINTPSWMDEFGEDIQGKRFEALKASYDGIGHEKGKKTNDNRTEITKVRSGLIISGQVLPTANDGSLLTRSILLSFESRSEDNPFTEEEAQNLRDIREVEEKGISSIVTEILKFRPTVQKHYPQIFSKTYSEIKDHFIKNSIRYSERLIMNYSCILSIVKLFNDKVENIDFGFQFQDLYNESIEQIKKLSEKISQSDYLSGFWNIMVFLLDNKQIEEGVDFIIKQVSSLKISEGRSGTIDRSWENPINVIYIRLSKIHPLYLELHRKQYGYTGVQITSLLHYLSNHRSYIGNVKNVRFKNTISSAFAFDYERLDVNLTRMDVVDIPEVNENADDNESVYPF